jgi:hypothetical protein
MAQPAERLLGCRAEELHLADCLESEAARTLQIAFPGASGRWGVRRSTFREGARPRHLLVLTGLNRALTAPLPIASEARVAAATSAARQT